ncbi:hypothetical protein P3W24_00790 [Luteibacter sp. PPL201]|jgi:uncharacterized protein (DUF58 family)|uniref:Uncharacterized protein n=1 Tax=Luteibacter sahnii TaxID=3021977 RepID=A0ABT6B5W7_9GAMM|nr:hypothetical protein [Luteibacter sp. PPL193]MDY1548557.1 hypothetical protein [Luteibacter sp. PPL193]
MTFVFPPLRRSRNPLVRALSVLAGLALLGVLLVFGVVVLGVLVAGSLVFFALRQWKLARSPRPVAAESRRPDVLEGEFTVIRQGRPVHH